VQWAQDLRQLVRTELARSTSAVAVRRQANLFHGVTISQIR
jgi:hypothetical protein